MSEVATNWRFIVDSDDLQTDAKRHLGFLVDSTECERLLGELVQNLLGAHVEDGSLQLVFRYSEFDDEECIVVCDEPHRGDIAADAAPASVAPVVRVHNGIGWESPGGGGFGFTGFENGTFVGGGSWSYRALQEAAERNSTFLGQLEQAGLSPRDVVSPSDYGQNWLIWHPATKNANGEPAVYFVSHGDCVAREVSAARDLAFGPLLLRIMAQEILGQVILDEVYS
jgi:hypothetical protein